MSSSHASGRRLAISTSFALRTVLVLGLFLAVACALAVSKPEAAANVEPDLRVLLRGMALIKVSITLTAVALLLWRFGRPVSRGVAAGYLAGVCLMAAANVLIWQLSFILVAAFFFHVALFGLLGIAWREDRFSFRARA